MGLENKLEVRDLQIPKSRKDLKQKIERDLLDDHNVLAFFYGGSIGNGNTDLYSDIDLRIVVKDALFEQYRQNKKERAKNWGNVLFFEDFPRSTYSIAHFDTFIKVDSFYYTTKDIVPSVWLNNIKIIKDHQSLLGNVLASSQHLNYEMNIEQFDVWRYKFFAYAHETYRRCKRNEIFYALNCLDWLRWSIAAGWYMDKGYPANNPGDWAKIEGERSKLTERQQELLKGWHSSRDPEQILMVMRTMLPEFVEVHRKLCEKLGVDENPNLISKILELVK
ncbi:hypothetical protein [Metabacillus indicus]|uniref:hypothetical protein n=1 Tax=Metabacillus indicus TaxID=246786 RepID=UPI003CF95515